MFILYVSLYVCVWSRFSKMQTLRCNWVGTVFILTPKLSWEFVISSTVKLGWCNNEASFMLIFVLILQRDIINVKHRTMFLLFLSCERNTRGLSQIFICWLSHQHDHFPLSLSSPLVQQESNRTPLVHSPLLFLLIPLTQPDANCSKKILPNVAGNEKGQPAFRLLALTFSKMFTWFRFQNVF